MVPDVDERVLYHLFGQVAPAQNTERHAKQMRRSHLVDTPQRSVIAQGNTGELMGKFGRLGGGCNHRLQRYEIVHAAPAETECSVPDGVVISPGTRLRAKSV